MKEINESLKNKNLTQKEYFIKSFAVLKTENIYLQS